MRTDSRTKWCDVSHWGGEFDFGGWACSLCGCDPKSFVAHEPV